MVLLTKSVCVVTHAVDGVEDWDALLEEDEEDREGEDSDDLSMEEFDALLEELEGAEVWKTVLCNPLT